MDHVCCHHHRYLDQGSYFVGHLLESSLGCRQGGLQASAGERGHMEEVFEGSCMEEVFEGRCMGEVFEGGCMEVVFEGGRMEEMFERGCREEVYDERCEVEENCNFAVDMDPVLQKFVGLD